MPSNFIENNLWVPSESQAYTILQNFLPKLADYSKTRNDAGLTGGVSRLSPFIQYRILPEWVVLKEVLQDYSWAEIEKFIDEVIWRNYWRGWMGHYPQVWSNYLYSLENNKDRLDNSDLQAAYRGETRIECFDNWVQELYKTGYLHNHVRMWFASIWIFTLKLPWYLGADFFLKLLLDGNECVNTLSWRWVAGLHTPGKHYLARAENIQRYTQGRYFPQGLLNETALPITEEASNVSTTSFLPKEIMILENFLQDACEGAGHLAWIISSDDLSVIKKIKKHSNVKYILCLDAVVVLNETNTSLSQANISLKRNFIEGLLQEQKIQASSKDFHTVEIEFFSIQDFENTKALALSNDLFQKKIDQITNNFRIDNWVVVMPPVGITSDFINENLSLRKLPIYYVKRQWDHYMSQFAKNGFFNFKKKISKEAILDLIAVSG